MLALHFVFSIISGTFTLYALFHNDWQTALESCINESNDELTKEFCGEGHSVVKGIIVSIFIVIWLLELCAIFNLISTVVVADCSCSLQMPALCVYLEFLCQWPKDDNAFIDC
jgi:hypothetical protein